MLQFADVTNQLLSHFPGCRHPFGVEVLRTEVTVVITLVAAVSGLWHEPTDPPRPANPTYIRLSFQKPAPLCKT